MSEMERSLKNSLTEESIFLCVEKVSVLTFFLNGSPEHLKSSKIV